MAIPRSEDALNALLRVMGCADVETALAKEWPAHRLRDIDLLADILEYRHDARSLQARQIGYGLADTEELRYLYCLELCRQSRGRGRFLDWVKLRATASMLSMSKAPGTLETLQKEMPDIAEVLEGKRTLPQDLDRFLVPLYDKLSTLTPMFTYFLGRVAHRLRMAGDHAGADLLLARAYALRAMYRALGTL